MRKVLVSMLVMLSMALSTYAIRPIHVAWPHQQSDGTTIKAYLHGDGFVAYYSTLDDKVLLPDGNGNLVYASMVNGKLVASALIAHEADARSAEETAFLAANNISANDAAVRQLALPMKKAPIYKIGASTSDGLGQKGKPSGGDVPSLGELTIPVIMVQFKDKKFMATTTEEKMNRFYNEEGYHDESYCVGSVKDYFVSQSYGNFVPTFKVVATVTLDNNYSYYGGDSPYQDARVEDMTEEAVEKAVTDRNVDFTQYYVDGRVPLISFLYAGPGQATGGNDNTIWPHFASQKQWNNDYATYYNGLKVGSYFVGNEIYGGSTSTTLMGMGVFVHEFSHALGLPDFYDTTYSYSGNAPFGQWSVMDEGPYVSYAYAPIGYNAYEKSYMGWLNIPELKDDAEFVTLSKQTDANGTPAVLIRNANNSNEYFILENRQADTWYPASFGTGLYVSRIAYSSSAWTRNNLNTNQNKKRAMLVTADGSKLNSNESSAQLFGNGVNNIQTFKLYDGTTQTSTPVFKVIKHNDGTITLNFKDRTLTNATAEGDVYEKVTDAASLADGDSIIIVCEDDQMALSVVQTVDNRGANTLYLADNKAYVSKDVEPIKLKLGTSGNVWGLIVEGNKYLSATSTANKLKTVSKADKYALATITIADGNATIQYKSNTKSPYLTYDMDGINFTCIDNPVNKIQIYRKGTVNAINSVSEKANGENETIYSITGQKVNRSQMRRGVYIVNGKKVVVK